NLTTPKDCKVIVFGQDPYPREESAIGVAFCDGAITSWEDTFSPSFRNIIKSVLISMNHLTKDSKIDEIRSKAKQLKLVSPNEWFLSTGRQAQSELKKHALFWKLTIQKIIETVFEVKEQTFQDKKEEEQTPSIVFVLWGGFAKQNLAPLILKANNEK
ncbi:MAG: putative TKL protein kinase, partial [Streblomastix strix]